MSSASLSIPRTFKYRCGGGRSEDTLQAEFADGKVEFKLRFGEPEMIQVPRARWEAFRAALMKLGAPAHAG
jgi:hypothetical protein